MEKAKQVGGSSSSSSSFSDLFGPKDTSSSSSSSSNGLFGSVFGPPATGLGKDSSHSGFMGAVRKQEYEAQYSNGKNGNPSLTNSKDNRYQSETVVEPCYFSSSIYYGGPEVYSPTSQPTVSQHNVVVANFGWTIWAQSCIWVTLFERDLVPLFCITQ
ncbi:hypothetical protein Vadar_009030 [Vaccinium darrowii]|uniref:Uncharacterized protein n=1 Tax=Vaccinium darrowii TaxID=229202 RepID=A0ACB7YLD0_9ERIC|nr:hypothetical protein Vadar_009030 [Vaccinium darrowii]